MATIQFIVGLGLFLMITLTINHFIYPSNVTLGFSVDGIVSIILLSIEFLGIYEVTSALTKFLKGVIEVYKAFRVIKKPRIYAIFNKNR